MRNENLRIAPSNAYQHVFQEIYFGDDFAAIVDIFGYSMYESFNDEYQELRKNLLDRVLELANEHLTEKQKQVFDLFLLDLTQQEIAEKLGKTQTTVNKQLVGDIAVNGYYRSGIFDKLRNISKDDEKIQEILKKIQEII